MRNLALGFLLAVVAAMMWVPRGGAQVTSDFVCSGGPRDGTPCTGDDDCFVACPASFGACVLVQGVCDGGEFDGFPCDCPGGTCVGTGAEGTCQGGVFAGDPCRMTPGEGACGTGSACEGTQKVCVGGDFQGFGCLRSDHCPAGSCRSTGRFCDGGDFADFSCATSSDCNLPASSTPPGVCRAPDFGCAAASPTPSRSATPTATRRVATATATLRSPAPGTATPTVRSPSPAATTPTPVTPSAPVGTPPTPGPGQAVVAAPAAKGTEILVVERPETVPLTGQITRIGSMQTCTNFIRRPGSAELALNPALEQDVAAGTLLTFGPCGVRQEFVRESCAVAPPGQGGQLSWLMLGVAALIFARIFRQKRSREFA